LRKLFLIISTLFILAHSFIPHEHEKDNRCKIQKLNKSKDIVTVLTQTITYDIGIDHLQNYVHANYDSDIKNDFLISQNYNNYLNQILTLANFPTYIQSTSLSEYYSSLNLRAPPVV
jgi:hypothetical protein